MIVDLDNASQAPQVTEPLMLTFDASVHYRVAMAPTSSHPRASRSTRPV